MRHALAAPAIASERRPASTHGTQDQPFCGEGGTGMLKIKVSARDA
jgi:hypothetical protein